MDSHGIDPVFHTYISRNLYDCLSKGFINIDKCEDSCHPLTGSTRV